MQISDTNNLFAKCDSVTYYWVDASAKQFQSIFQDNLAIIEFTALSFFGQCITYCKLPYYSEQSQI